MAFNPFNSDFLSYNFDPNKPIIGDSSTIMFGSHYTRCANTKEKEKIRQYWLDLLGQTGVTVNYWVNNYSTTEHDFIYGENPTSKFIGPKIVRGFIDFKTDNAILTKFGFVTDNDMNLIIPIPEFANVWGSRSPNIGDLFSIEEESCDRPEDQNPKIFQVTEKYDKIKTTDLFGGHYIWKLIAKRFDYSYENAPDETPDTPDQVSDTDFIGILTGSEQTKSPEKSYTDNVDDLAKEDMDNSVNNNDAVYGRFL